MRYLIDTNVISEMSKPEPNKTVTRWISNIPETDLFLSVVTIGEIVFGINKLKDKIRKAKLSSWLEKVTNTGFDDRILSIDLKVMKIWGEMCARLPRNLPVQDTFIAATAIAHNMIVATRNIKDFNDIAELTVYNPWND